MYSDSSSTNESSDDSFFPGYVQIPRDNCSGLENSSGKLVRFWGDNPRSNIVMDKDGKLFQVYKGQLQLSVYINCGLLTVHVKMAKHLKSKQRDICDAYVKLLLAPDKTGKTRCKTEVVSDTNHPVFDEKFSFELLDEDIDKRLLISVWNRDDRGQQCEFLGCTSFGIESLQKNKKVIDGWYYLLTSEFGRSKHLKVVSSTTSGESRHSSSHGSNEALWMETHKVLLEKGSKGYGFSISGNNPVIICRVDPGSAARFAGLQKDDFITKVDGINVLTSTSEHVARLIRNSHGRIMLEIQRPKKSKYTQSQSIKSRSSHEPFVMTHLEKSPRRPLCSSTPCAKQARPRSVESVTELMNQDNGLSYINFETKDYGWLEVPSQEPKRGHDLDLDRPDTAANDYQPMSAFRSRTGSVSSQQRGPQNDADDGQYVDMKAYEGLETIMEVTEPLPDTPSNDVCYSNQPHSCKNFPKCDILDNKQCEEDIENFHHYEQINVASGRGLLQLGHKMYSAEKFDGCFSSTMPRGMKLLDVNKGNNILLQQALFKQEVQHKDDLDMYLDQKEASGRLERGRSLMRRSIRVPLVSKKKKRVSFKEFLADNFSRRH